MNSMYCLFEDAGVSGFSPLIATRHLAELLVGHKTLEQRASGISGLPVLLHGRRRIMRHRAASACSVDPPASGTIIFLNARIPLTRALHAALQYEGEWVMRDAGVVLAVRLNAGSAAKLDWEQDYLVFDSSLPERQLPQEPIYHYTFIWDLIYDNSRRIVEDADAIDMRIEGRIMPGAYVVSDAAVAIGVGSVVRPGAVIDASDGPVIIGDGVTIMSNAVVLGPVSIGHGSTVKVGATIYGGTSIGPHSKVGGEIEGSIILGYSNKQHHGFLGHSYLGHWVNLGAGTSTSDLKNNYGNVRVDLGQGDIDSCRTFIGSLIGDHAKTAINTSLNTGTVVGVGANIFGSGFPSKRIDDFAWGTASERFRADAAIDLARRVMARRGVKMSSADEDLLRLIHAAAR